MIRDAYLLRLYCVLRLVGKDAVEIVQPMHSTDTLPRPQLLNQLVLAQSYLILVEILTLLAQRLELIDIVVDFSLLSDVSQIQLGQMFVSMVHVGIAIA